MRRRHSTVLATSLATLAACHGPAGPRQALEVSRPFAATYSGRVSALDAGDLAPVEPSSPAAPDAGPGAHAIAPAAAATGVVTFRATWLELPVEHARALLPGLAAAPPSAVEPLPDGGTRSWSDDVVASAGPSRASTQPRWRSLGVAGAHVDPARLRSALAALDPTSRSAVQTATVDVGHSAELATLDQRAFVRSAGLVPAADSLLVGDIDVATFRYGRRLVLDAGRDGDALRIGVAWRESVPVLPVPTASAPMFTFQVPALTRHLLTASTRVHGPDALVLASLPGAAPATVTLLCVEVDPSPAPLAAR